MKLSIDPHPLRERGDHFYTKRIRSASLLARSALWHGWSKRWGSRSDVAICILGWNQSFFGDLHVQGIEGIMFYTRQKTVLTRWDNTYFRTEGW